MIMEEMNSWTCRVKLATKDKKRICDYDGPSPSIRLHLWSENHWLITKKLVQD